MAWPHFVSCLYALLAEDTPDVEEAALADPPPPPRPPCSLSLLSRSRYCWCGGISCCVLPLAESASTDDGGGAPRPPKPNLPPPLLVAPPPPPPPNSDSMFLRPRSM